MKKLITTTATIIAMSVGIFAADASPRDGKGHKPEVGTHNGSGAGAGLYSKHANNRRTYTFTTVDIVQKGRFKFMDTYLHTVYPGGREVVTLVSSERLAKRGAVPVSVKFERERQMFAGQPYLVIYRVTRFSNGKITRVIESRKLIKNYHGSWDKKDHDGKSWGNGTIPGRGGNQPGGNTKGGNTKGGKGRG
ncbi:MAG: hypothetical protein R2684_11155 [Pyrinomonadaceae bacterium]